MGVPFMRDRIKTLCDHCGNESWKNLSCTDQHTEADRSIEYLVYRCDICEGVILLKQITHIFAPRLKTFGGGTKEPELESEEQLWPTPLSLSPEVPERIRELYDEARLVRRSPSSFVVQIGRALEALTRAKCASGRDLNDRLNWLIKRKQLPEVFGQMGHINRILRNWGAHDAGLEVEPEDVEVVDEFFRAIVEYLYVAPATVKRVQSLIDSRKSSA